MPAVLRIGPYRFHFYSIDRLEPRHIHVTRDTQSVKFWLEPVELAYNEGYNQAELRKIMCLVEEHRDELIRGWNRAFGFGTDL